MLNSTAVPLTLVENDVSDEYETTVRAFIHIDLVGSTTHCVRRGERGGYALLRVYLNHMVESVCANNGELVKLLGDGVQACFLHAGEALDCALMFTQSLDELRVKPRLRAKTALTYGNCLRYSLLQRTDYYAQEVMLAARLVEHGGPEGIVMSKAFRHEPTVRERLQCCQVRQQVLNMRGFPGLQPVYHLQALRPSPNDMAICKTAGAI